MATLYKIANWSENFDHRDTAQTDGPLKWIKVPTKTDGFGFRRLALEKNPHELLAAWYLMLGIAAKQPRDHRGELSRDGVPLGAEDLALITGFHARIFARAFAFFSEPRQGWLTSTACEDSQASANNATRLDKIRLDKTTEDKTTVEGAAGAPPQTDAEWLEALGQKPAYSGIDIARERSKCETWCENNRKKFSRQRFVNWLNKAERPIDAPKAGARFGNLF